MPVLRTALNPSIRIFFAEFQLCIGWRKVEVQGNCKKITLCYKGILEITGNNECCFTVPRTVHDCSFCQMIVT